MATSSSGLPVLSCRVGGGGGCGVRGDESKERGLHFCLMNNCSVKINVCL